MMKDTNNPQPTTRRFAMDGFEYRDPMYDSFDDYFCPECGNAAEPPGLCEDCAPTDDTEKEAAIDTK